MTRQEAKKAWALNEITRLRKQGIANPVLVMPVFEEVEEGVFEPTRETGLDNPNGNPEWTAVAVVSSQRTMNDAGFVNEQFRSALLRMKKVNNTFTAGEVLNGKIIIMESTTATNAANLDQDIKYINADAQAAGLPCMIGGDKIYRKAIFTEDLSRTDQTIQADNLDEIREALAINKVANSPALKAAARRKELEAIPVSKRTAAQKAELLALA